MYYEQDYIMRLIKQVIRALIGILLNKKTTMEYDMPVNRQQTSGEDFLARLISLADAGKICEAENELSDTFLEEHGFSREEIRQGVLDVAKRMGALYAAVAIMDEDPEAL